MAKSQLPFEKNDQFTMVIDNLDNRGFGVGHYEGVAVFVEGALPGETVQVQVIKCAKSYAVAKLWQVTAPAPERVEPLCPVYAKCGGCSLQHLDYTAQAARKQQQVLDALTRLGGFHDAEVRPILAAEQICRYRNKAQFPIGPDGSVGFYRRRSHDVVDTDDCPIQTENAMLACRALRTYMTRYRVSGYDEKTGKGYLRHLMTRSNRRGELLVTLVVNGDKLPKEDELTAIFREAVPGLAGIVLNENRRRDNVIMGNTCRTLWGDSRITETLCGKVFSISPLSFFQVNTEQTEVLYRAAREAAKLTGQETLLDLYCGIGTIGITMADGVSRLIGIESVPQAIEDARQNATENGIQNAEFHAAKAEELLPQMAKQGLKADVAVLDPPRGGCEEALLAAVTRIAPARIVYVSCNPATLARDCAILAQSGYTLQYAQPVDLFPMTEHTETVAQLVRK